MASFFSQLGDAVVGIAPTIASAFGGPLAGQAVSLVENALGLTPAPDATLDDRAKAATAALQQAQLDQIIKLKQLDLDFKKSLVDANIKLVDLANQDRASARQRQVDMKDWAPTVMAFVILFGFFGLLGAMAMRAWPEANQSMLNTMVAVLGTIVVSIANYYFGSSAGSAAKTKILADQTPPISVGAP